MTQGDPPNLLEAIVAATRKRVDSQRARESADTLAARATGRTPRAELFRQRLTRANSLNVIAECKRRSPSRGVLRADYDPVAIARSYERAGAAALSVLTEPTFFDGAVEHLAAVRDSVAIPVLLKDFVVDDYQLTEAVAAGADAVLLIVSALSEDELTRLHRAAESAGLAALVEVHDEEEVERALAAGATIVGVNNRNLRTLAVDTRASEAIAKRLPKGVIAVSESGLKHRDDLVRMSALGYQAFLIGERFMTAADPGAALAEVLQ